MPGFERHSTPSCDCLCVRMLTRTLQIYMCRTADMHLSATRVAARIRSSKEDTLFPQAGTKLAMCCRVNHKKKFNICVLQYVSSPHSY